MGGKTFLRELHEFLPIKINCMFIRDMSFRVRATIDIPRAQPRSKAVLKHAHCSKRCRVCQTAKTREALGLRRFTAAFPPNVIKP
jgi:hypothetical protein